MKHYEIEYAVYCTVGKIRRNNEDNFYCDGKIREDVNSNQDVAFSGKVSSDTNEMFAVFDGMGGEACGEVASFVAASHAQLFARDRGEYEEYLYELGELLNEKVREETEARSLVLMGTTAALVQFCDTDIYVLNAGDSRVYRLLKHELKQLSVDHIAPGYGGKAITKFLGMPSDDKLRPYIAAGEYKAGDVYLLCTDGVTDMLTDAEILDIIDNKRPLGDTCRALIGAAMANGGVDNATAILLRVTK